MSEAFVSPQPQSVTQELRHESLGMPPPSSARTAKVDPAVTVNSVCLGNPLAMCQPPIRSHLVHALTTLTPSPSAPDR